MKCELIAEIPLKIHIVNSYSHNFGDLAIISTMISTLKEAIPNCEISVAASDPAITSKYIHTLTVRSLSSRSSLILIQALNLIFFFRNAVWIYFMSKGINLFFLAKKKTRLALYEYKDADLILSCGGGYLNDNYGTSFLSCLMDVYLANTLNKPIIYYAQSIGPFNHKYLKKIAGLALNNSKQIVLRDQISKTFTDELHLKKPNVTITADIALLLPSVDKEAARRILDKERTATSFPFVTITVRAWIFPGNADPSAKMQAYIESLEKLIEHIIENYGANVLIIPMEIYEYRENTAHTFLRKTIHMCKKSKSQTDFMLTGERDLIDYIVEKVNRPEKVKVLNGKYSPSEIKTIISFSRIHIATRMHSSIFAAANLIPIIGIAYEPKMTSFMHSLDQSMFLTDINTVTASELKIMFDSLWNNIDENVGILSEQVEKMKKEATKNTEIIRDFYINQYIT